MNIETKKIGEFLLSLSDIDYSYLDSVMDYRNALQNMIKRHNLSKEDFCEHFKIKLKDYENFTKGNYPYSLRDGAMINAVYIKLESERLPKTAPFQVAGEREK